MCHHRGDIPEEMPDWTMERADEAEEALDDEELPEFLNEDGDEMSVLTDGGE
ncbi:hypothetical protein [Haloarcula laminariae]|uniref:hypothetical protein n=1 Tax=Haloarcula laminariae TaxID=2961577 RepID=UPI0021C93460|nr:MULTISPECIES: hypothetical protein [Halomicroarcula]